MLPGALPSIFVGLRYGLGIMWLTLIVAETISASSGIEFMAGFGAALARGVEYGSVIFIAGNMPMISEIAPLLIVIRIEQLDYAGAAALGLVMLLVSFAILLLLNLLERRMSLRA